MKKANYFRISRPVFLVNKVWLSSFFVLICLFLFNNYASSQTMSTANLRVPYPALKSSPNAVAALEAQMTVMQSLYGNKTVKYKDEVYNAAKDPDGIMAKARLIESVFFSVREKGFSVKDALDNAFLTHVHPQLDYQQRLDALVGKNWSLEFQDVVNIVQN